MSILFTGFDPFDGASVNPSWEAVCLLPEAIAGHSVHRLQLPTVYGQAAALLREEIARVRPSIVIACGVANGRPGVTPELVAINYRFARIADNAGQRYSGVPIAPEGPAAHMTSLPVHAMIEAVRAEGVPAYLSLSAGAYVCNDVYYALLACEAEYGHRGLFVHVPGTEAVDAEQSARAIAICAETAIRQGGQYADR